MTLHQHPDHVVQKGQTILVEGKPMFVTNVEPIRHEGYFLDFGRSVEPRVVVVTLEPYTGQTL